MLVLSGKRPEHSSGTVRVTMSEGVMTYPNATRTMESVQIMLEAMNATVSVATLVTVSFVMMQMNVLMTPMNATLMLEYATTPMGATTAVVLRGSPGTVSSVMMSMNV